MADASIVTSKTESLGKNLDSIVEQCTDSMILLSSGPSMTAVGESITKNKTTNITTINTEAQAIAEIANQSV